MNSLFEKFQIKSNSLHLKHDNEIFRLGQKAESIYLVKKGRVQLFRDDLNGNRIILHQAFNDQFFAEASINAEHYHCSALCIGDTELHVININYFNHFLQNNVEFSNAWIRHLSVELRRQRASVERLNLKTAAERITHYIMTEGNDQGELTFNGSLTDIAQIIGLSRESLYRTLSKMKTQKQLIQSKQTLKLL